MMFMPPMVPAATRTPEDTRMENVLRPLLIVGGSVAITLLAGWLVDLALRKADVRHPDTPLWGLLRRCRPPSRW